MINVSRLAGRAGLVSVLFAVCWFLSGCQTGAGNSNVGGSPDPSGPQAVAAARTDTTNTVTAERLDALNVGDKIKIEFSDMAVQFPPREERIKEDGTVTLLEGKTFVAAGKTRGQLEKEIHDFYVPRFYLKMTVSVQQQRETEKAYQALQAKISAGQSQELIRSSRDVKGIKVLSTQVEAKDPKSLRQMADRLKDQIRSGIILLGALGDGKVMLLCVVTPDLSEKYPAQKLIRELATYVGGTGGGRPDMAQAGGTNIAGLNQALEKIYEII